MSSNGNSNKSIRSDISIADIAPASPFAKNGPLHHVGNPPTAFRNPWSSAQPVSISKVFSTRFLRTEGRNNVPVPANRQGLAPIRKPDWGLDVPDKFKATWIGHASFLVETSTTVSGSRGVRILLDPVFSERTSPVQWFGPKRYSPPPCTVGDLPEVDIIAISHNHYDHLDAWTVKEVWQASKARGRTPLIACALGNKAFFINLLHELPAADIIELDWWHGVQIDIKDIGNCELICTPAQHTSARSWNDRDKALWCSWTVREIIDDKPGKTLFFAGDTGYRHVNIPNPTAEEEDAMPRCSAFKEVGDTYGPIDLALLPIGLYSPRDFMSSVHCAPEDSVCIHFDLKSKKSIGMHYGTVRGGISAYYEDVLEPPKRWKEESEKKGLVWGVDVGLCDIGETILI